MATSSGPPPPGLVTPARFPTVAAARGHYESVYLTAADPEGGRAVWIRYTVHKRPGRPARGFTWFTLFDAAAGVVARKERTAAPTADATNLIRLGDGAIGGAGAWGRALGAEWELAFHGIEDPLWHLPSAWMYRAGLPRTKLLSPYPDVRVSGEVRLDGRVLKLEQWPGTVGHNWGSEHAERAVWLHGANFDGHPDAWLDVAVARVRMGPLTTPWVANGALSLEGRRHRLGGLRRLPSIDAGPGRCRFTLSGDAITVTGEASAPREHFVGWLYAQPDGPERQTINCSIADLRLEVARAGRAPLTLVLAGAGAYELQMAERCPEIPLQPFSDG